MDSNEGSRILAAVDRCTAEVRAVRLAFAPPTPSAAIYWLLAVPPAWAAASLAFPETTFARSAAYRVMALAADEELWSFGSAALFFAAALCGVVRGRRLRGIGVALLGCWHFAVGVCIFGAMPSAIVSAPYFVLAGLAAVMFWRTW